MVRAENPLADGQQDCELVTSTNRITRHPRPIGELVAAAQGVGVVGAEDPLADGQQGCELVTSTNRITRHPRPIGESVAST